MQVFELMKTHIIKTTAEATVRDAVDMMDLYQISGLPVVDSADHVIGVVSEYDIIHSLLPHYAEAAAVTAPQGMVDFRTLVDGVKSRSVAEVMTAQAITIDENANILQAASLMLKHRIKRLPVTSENRLVGIISRIDICQAILEGQL